MRGHTRPSPSMLEKLLGRALAERMLGTRGLALSFLQPVAMGVLLGQGWHVYNDIFMRGSSAGIGLCTTGMFLGLLLGVAVCVRASQQGQAGLRLSLFWMSCTLNGGLAFIAQLRLRVGRFRANDDALVMNSFLSSGLLGSCLPHMVLKVLEQPEAEVIMPCVLGLLMTEAICSSDAMPLLQVVVSVFLCGVGVRGMMADGKLIDGANGTGGVARSDRSSGNIAGAADGSGGHEPFFPATAMDKRCYSPHFLVSRRAHCVPRNTSIVPLISLVVRQGEPSRGSSGGKGAGSGGRDRGAAGGGAGGGGKERASRVHGEQSRSEQAAVVQQAPPPVRDIDAEEVLRQKTSVEAAEVGSDIRWDVIFEEMRRVDTSKAAKGEDSSGKPVLPGFCPVDTDAHQSLHIASPDSTDITEPLDGALDAPVEVFAQLEADGDEDVDDSFLAGGADNGREEEEDEEQKEKELAKEKEEEEESQGAAGLISHSWHRGSPNDLDNGEEADGEEDFGGSQRLATLTGRSSAYLEDDASDVDQVPLEVLEAPQGGASAEEQLDGGPEEEIEAEACDDDGPEVPAEADELAAEPVEVDRVPPNVENHQHGDAWAESHRQEGDRRKRRERGEKKRGDRDRRPGNRSERYLEELEKRERERESRERDERRQLAFEREIATKEARCAEPVHKVSEDSADIDDIEELEVPLCSTPSAGLKLIELGRPCSSHTSPQDAEEELLDDLTDDIMRNKPRDAMELTAEELQSGMNAKAEEFVPAVEDSTLSAPKPTLRADAEAFCPHPPGMAAFRPLKNDIDGEAVGSSQGLKLFPEEGSQPASAPIVADQALGSGAGPDEGLEYPCSGPWHNTEAEWTGASHSSWAAPKGAAHAEVEAEAEKAFDGYDYNAEAWPGYNYCGDVSDVWSGYAAGYGAGDRAQQNFSTTDGYGYEAGSDGAVGSGYMSANAAEFVPGSAGLWAGSDNGHMAIEGLGSHFGGDDGPFADERHMHSQRDPVMSLIDSEVPDPGTGRASTVRRPEGYGPGKSRGRGRGRGSGEDSLSQTLRVSNVEDWMSETYLSDIFASMAVATNVKIVHGSGYTPGYAVLEFASHDAALGVLEALGGGPAVSPDGHSLYVNWASEMMPGGEGVEGWHDSARGSDGRAEGNRGERRNRRERDRRDDKGKGSDSRGEAGWHDAQAADDRGRGKGKKGAGHNGRKGDAVETDQRRSRGDGAGAGNAGKDDSNTWAYVDPKDQVRTGFTLQDMRQWYESGYFDGDLSVALCTDKRGKVPPKREFYPLRQWFPDLSKSFTYVPKF